MATLTTTLTDLDVRIHTLIDDNFQEVGGGYLGVQDNKLAPIGASGKVLNTATTGTTLTVPNTLVLRDSGGSFSASSITTNYFITGALAATAISTTTLSVIESILAGSASASFDSIRGNSLLITSAGSITDFHAVFLNVDNLFATSPANQVCSYYAYADLPDPTTVTGMFAVVSDDGYLYYSNGTIWVKIYSAATVDSLANGLFVKDPVVAATTGTNITLANLQTIDGVLLEAADRVLVKDQTAAKENGIYAVVDGGAWTRTTDANSGANIETGMYTIVRGGTTNRNSGWILTTPEGFTVDTDPLNFALLISAESVTSVDLAAPSELIVSNNPVTAADGSGTLTLAWNQQNPNAIFVGPDNTLTPGVPGFRLMSPADMFTMVGATSSSNGLQGAVPAPQVADRYSFIRGDGQWLLPGTGGLGSISSVGLSTTLSGLDILGSPLTSSGGVLVLEGVLGVDSGGTGLTTGDLAGNDGLALKFNASSNKLEFFTVSGSFTPAGATTAVQFNDGDGNLGGDANRLGAELLTNFTFVSDLSSWTAGSGWAWSSGAQHTSGTATLTQDVIVRANITYKIGFTITGRTAGTIGVKLGSVTLTATGPTTTFSATQVGLPIVATDGTVVETLTSSGGHTTITTAQKPRSITSVVSTPGGVTIVAGATSDATHYTVDLSTGVITFGAAVDAPYTYVVTYIADTLPTTLTITPSTDFDGTITAVTCKQVFAFTYDKTLGVVTATTYHGDGSSLTNITPTQIGIGNVTNDSQVKRSEMAVPYGVATLNVSGKIVSDQLPTGLTAAFSSLTGNPIDNEALAIALNDPTLGKVDKSILAQPLGVATLDADGHVVATQLPDAGGSGLYAIVTKTADYGPDAVSDTFIIVNAAGGAVVITLPDIGTPSVGKAYYIKKKDSSVNTVTIACTGVNTIDGSSTFVLTAQGEVVAVVKPDTGTDWNIF